MSRRGGGGGAETNQPNCPSQRKRGVLSISKLRAFPSHPISGNEGISRSRQKQSALSSCKCDAMRCLLRGGTVSLVVWALSGPVCWRWSQSAVLAPNARTGSWLQRPWPPWDLAAFFRAVFSSHPRCCAAQCPSRHLHFVPFRPRSGRLDLQTSLSPFCILHSPRPRPALHTLTPHFANSCILAIINCVPTQPKLPSDPPST